MLYDVKTCRDVGKYNLYTLKRKCGRKRMETEKKAGEERNNDVNTFYWREGEHPAQMEATRNASKTVAGKT